ncbi:uncharacterized protein LOC135922244 [Gordionus sp. m RMFG-2023]|uniref:uncharacterized protein LOC135922244 n=1 Tax=Gordionus sp. m RMFG-2023 TaxID=3053472 RepID=UPI0031FBAE35
MYNMTREFFLSHFDLDIQDYSNISSYNIFNYNVGNGRKTLFRLLAAKIPIKNTYRIHKHVILQGNNYEEKELFNEDFKSEIIGLNKLNDEQPIALSKQDDNFIINDNQRIIELEKQLSLLKSHIADIVINLEKSSSRSDSSTHLNNIDGNLAIPNKVSDCSSFMIPPPLPNNTVFYSSPMTSLPLTKMEQVIIKNTLNKNNGQLEGNKNVPNIPSIPNMLPHFLEDIGKIKLKPVIPNCTKRSSNEGSCYCRKCTIIKGSGKQLVKSIIKTSKSDDICQSNNLCVPNDILYNDMNNSKFVKNKNSQADDTSPMNLIAKAIARKFAKTNLHEVKEDFDLSFERDSFPDVKNHLNADKGIDTINSEMNIQAY